MSLVSVYGVSADGSRTLLGSTTESAELKSVEIVQSYFGGFEAGDGSDADMCHAAMCELMEYMKEIGWTPPQRVLNPV